MRGPQRAATAPRRRRGAGGARGAARSPQRRRERRREWGSRATWREREERGRVRRGLREGAPLSHPLSEMCCGVRLRLKKSSGPAPGAGHRPRENITGVGALPWSDEPAPTSRLRGTAGVARSRRATRDLRAGSPPKPVGGEGGSPVPVPSAAPARSHPTASVRTAHLDSRRAPRGSQAVPLRDCSEALPRRAIEQACGSAGV